MIQENTPTVEQIQAILEVAIDADLPNFDMRKNWYEDYGMDSLGAIALVVEVNKVFGVRLPEARMPEIRTGEQLLLEVTALQAARAKAGRNPASAI